MNSRGTARRVLTVLFLLLGAMRLYEFSQTGATQDVLSGVGLLLLAFSTHREALATNRTATPAMGPLDRFARYAAYAGLALVGTAIVMRLTS
jgi:hypothetical protein